MVEATFPTDDLKVVINWLTASTGKPTTIQVTLALLHLIEYAVTTLESVAPAPKAVLKTMVVKGNEPLALNSLLVELEQNASGVLSNVPSWLLPLLVSLLEKALLG